MVLQIVNGVDNHFWGCSGMLSFLIMYMESVPNVEREPKKPYPV